MVIAAMKAGVMPRMNAGMVGMKTAGTMNAAAMMKAAAMVRTTGTRLRLE